MKAYWQAGVERRVETVDALHGLIAEVESLGMPMMLFLEHESGTMLVAGLGHAETILSFVGREGNTFHSVGDKDRSGVLRFWCRDQLDEFLAETAVPGDVGSRAADMFYETGEPPSNVTWEPDW